RAPMQIQRPPSHDAPRNGNVSKPRGTLPGVPPFPGGSCSTLAPPRAQFGCARVWGMQDMTERIMVLLPAGLVIVGLIWFRNNQPAALGACVQLAGPNNEIPGNSREGDRSFRPCSSPDCSSESRITI